MAQCKMCDRSGWFMSVTGKGLCKTCDYLFKMDLTQKVRILQDCQTIIQNSQNMETRLSRCDLAIQHLKSLQQYELREIVTTIPEPTEVLRNYEIKRREIIKDGLEKEHQSALNKASVAQSAKSKISALSKAVLAARSVKSQAPDLAERTEIGLLTEIARITVADYLEKARKAEFKNQKKKALEQYYEALYFLKHDEIDDRLQADNIKMLEDKIVELGGTIGSQPQEANLEQNWGKV